MAILHSYPWTWIKSIESEQTGDQAFELDLTFPSDKVQFTTATAGLLDSARLSWQSATSTASVPAVSFVATSATSDGSVIYALDASNASYETSPTASTFGPVNVVDSDFDIIINYSGDPTYQAAFTQAVARWEQVIIADIPDIGASQYGFIDDLDWNFEAMDGRM